MGTRAALEDLAKQTRLSSACMARSPLVNLVDAPGSNADCSTALAHLDCSGQHCSSEGYQTRRDKKWLTMPEAHQFNEVEAGRPRRRFISTPPVGSNDNL